MNSVPTQTKRSASVGSNIFTLETNNSDRNFSLSEADSLRARNGLPDDIADASCSAETDPEEARRNFCSGPVVARPEEDCTRHPTESVILSRDTARDHDYEAKRRLKSAELNTTYTDETSTVCGCRHYRRRCKLHATCCDLYVTCRVCHDEEYNGSHHMDRFAVDSVLCMVCKTTQLPGPRCINSDCPVERFARYFCSICHLYDDEDCDIYHCAECGLCRKGRREDNFHCNLCNGCITMESKNRHVCLENSLRSRCPCCLEDMFSSRERVVYMSCGHAMHATCWDKYIATNYTCPICSKSMTDMSAFYQALDRHVEDERRVLASEYRNRVQRILCNDCNGISSVPFHFQWHKCAAVKEDQQRCGSYNTRLI